MGNGLVGHAFVSLCLILCVSMMSLCVSVRLGISAFGGVGCGLVSLCLGLF